MIRGLGKKDDKVAILIHTPRLVSACDQDLRNDLHSPKQAA